MLTRLFAAELGIAAKGEERVTVEGTRDLLARAPVRIERGELASEHVKVDQPVGLASAVPLGEIPARAHSGMVAQGGTAIGQGSPL